MALTIDHDSPEEHLEPELIGMLPILHYVFEDTKIGTSILMDKGSNTSLISTKLVKSLNLEGKPKITTVTKACETQGQTQIKIHHIIELTDRMGMKHRVRCIEVDFIIEPQGQPDYEEIYKLFPHLPKGCLQRPQAEVRLLLGQNVNILLPTGGAGQPRKKEVSSLEKCRRARARR